jgi:hypothetical protein
VSVNPEVVFKDRADARSAPKPAAKPAPDRSRRRPLGLQPVGDDPEAQRRPAPGETLDATGSLDIFGVASTPKSALAGSVSLENVLLIANTLADLARAGEDFCLTKIGELRSQMAGLELSNAKLEAKLAEAQSKVNELAFVSERLRIEARGPPGVAGPMGRDGPRGERGEKGDEGKQAMAAPRIASWLVHAATFEIQPLLSDGTRGAVLPLRPLFDAFNEAIIAGDDDLEADADASARLAAEAEAERAHWAR